MVKIKLMKKIGQKGELNVLVIPLVLVCILLIVALVWAFSIYKKEQNYKNNTDAIAAEQAKKAQAAQAQTDQNTYNEKEKQPLRTYIGPSDFGSLKIEYPKTWSVYVDTTGNSNNAAVDGYGYPGVVPNTGSQGNTGATAYALRFQVLNETYDQVLQNIQSQNQGSQNQVTITPYQPKNVKGVIGVRVDGAIEQNIQGSMVILPLRTTTLEIYTEAQQFVPDFNNYILPNFSFVP